MQSIQVHPDADEAFAETVIKIVEQFAPELQPRVTLEPVLEPWWQRFSGPFLYYPSRRYLPTPLRAFVDFTRGLRHPGGTAAAFPRDHGILKASTDYAFGVRSQSSATALRSGGERISKDPAETGRVLNLQRSCIAAE